MQTYSRFIMSALYIIAGGNHFRNPEFYIPMMPPWIPRHRLMIVLSGVAEVVLGLLLLWGPTQRIASLGIICMLLVFLSVHFYMLQTRKTVFRKIPVLILLARIPLQFLLIYWASLFI